MKPFDELTRLGQLRRMRQLAQKALEAYGMQDARLTFQRYFANVTYRVDVPAIASQKGETGYYAPNRYLLRILLSGDIKYALGELTWLAALSNQAGLPVPAPVPTTEGDLLIRITTVGIPEGRIVSLMRWIDGQQLGENLLPRHYLTWGQTVARLHQFAAAWQPPQGFERYVWDWDGLLGGRGFGTSVDELILTMPERLQEPFRIVSQEARTVMEALGKAPDAYGLVHGDMYSDNVLFKGGEALPIDFEDCGFGYWLWDIALALESQPWTNEWRTRRDAFLEGYTRVRALPESQVKHLDLFIAIDYATCVLWASQFMLDDPGRREEHEEWRNEYGAKLLRYFEHRQPGLD